MTSKLDSDITQILELSYKEFNVTMMNMAKLPGEKEIAYTIKWKL